MINNLPRKNSLDDSNNNILHSVRPSHVNTWALVNKIKVEHVLNHSWRRFLWGLFGPKGIFVSILIFIWRYHCVKSVQIRSFFWSVFSNIRTEYGEMLRISPYSVWIRENTDQKKHFSFGGTGSLGRGLSLFLSSTSIRPRKIRHWLIVLHLKWLSLITARMIYSYSIWFITLWDLGFDWILTALRLLMLNCILIR